MTEAETEIGGLDRQAAALIGAYQAAFAATSSLAPALKGICRHVIAESCEAAARETRRLRSEALAERFEAYRRSFDDELGAAGSLGREQAIKAAKKAAFGSVTLNAIWLKIGACVVAMGAVATWFENVGATLVHSGGGLHGLWLLLVYLGGGGWLRDLTNSVEQARNATDPLSEQLAKTLNVPESAYFGALGADARAPARPSLSLAGPAALAGVTLAWVAFAACVIAVLVGAVAALSKPT